MGPPPRPRAELGGGLGLGGGGATLAGGAGPRWCPFLSGGGFGGGFRFRGGFFKHGVLVGWSTAEQFDVVVIGGGPGGYAAALYGAGGRAQHRRGREGQGRRHLPAPGCIPAKELLETAHVYRTVAGAKEFGVQAEQPTIDFAVSQARKQKVVDQLWKGLQGLMKSRKITRLDGHRHARRRPRPCGSATARS